MRFIPCILTGGSINGPFEWVPVFDGVTTHVQLVSRWQPTSNNCKIILNAFRRSTPYAANYICDDIQDQGGGEFRGYVFQRPDKRVDFSEPWRGSNFINGSPAPHQVVITDEYLAIEINPTDGNFGVQNIGCNFLISNFWHGQIHRVQLIDLDNASNSLDVNLIVKSGVEEPTETTVKDSQGVTIGNIINLTGYELIKRS